MAENSSSENLNSQNNATSDKEKGGWAIIKETAIKSIVTVVIAGALTAIGLTYWDVRELKLMMKTNSDEHQSISSKHDNLSYQVAKIENMLYHNVELMYQYGSELKLPLEKAKLEVARLYTGSIMYISNNTPGTDGIISDYILLIDFAEGQIYSYRVDRESLEPIHYLSQLQQIINDYEKGREKTFYDLYSAAKMTGCNQDAYVSTTIDMSSSYMLTTNSKFFSGLKDEIGAITDEKQKKISKPTQIGLGFQAATNGSLSWLEFYTHIIDLPHVN